MILLIGLPKSGTSSFQFLFQKIGYKPYHWNKGRKYIGTMIKNNKINNKPLLNDFLDTDVITQMDVCLNYNNNYWPQIVDYKQLFKENPNAIFILNKRNPSEILNSFKNWIVNKESYYKRIFKYNPELITNKTDEGFINFINKFYIDVETYFKKNINAKFMSYDINNDTIQKLTKYIDIKDFKTFPKKNVNTKKVLLNKKNNTR